MIHPVLIFVENFRVMKVFEPFLKQVVEKYYADCGMEGCCFVFPNRRSMLFFRKHLAEEVKVKGVPLLAPRMISQNDFFCEVGGLRVSDKITLLLELYECYKVLNPSAETLDDFIFWGDVLLGDFNDVDKYLVNPHSLFTNVSDLKAIQDDFSYLNDVQREAIEKFVGHFRTWEAKGEKDVKENFMLIWNILEPLYSSFNERLRAKGLAYEGMVYRDFVKSLETRQVRDILAETFPDVTKFVFVGLNALTECEKFVMRKMRDAGVAEFCWDFSGDMLTDPLNKSSLFMRDNVKEFPQTFDFEDVGAARPQVNVVSVPSSLGQVKVLPEILNRIPDWRPEETALVLPDEQLLTPLLNSLPPEVEKVNVTMGYNMTGSALYPLMTDISALQIHARQRAGGWSFYHKQVRNIFASGIFCAIADDGCREIVSKIKKDAKIYVPESDFKGSALLELIFRPVITDPSAVDSEQIRAFAEYQKAIAKEIAVGLASTKELGTEAEFARQWYRGVNRLMSKDLEVMPYTWVRLLDQLMRLVSVPFEGEPLEGLQIMGPLETRALDFSNLVLFSANEGTFPKRTVSSSFIPPELRRGFGLPTYEFQDAVLAYYFYRMIARAENVWMLYDARTEGVQSGEESRYVKQLVYHFDLPVKRYVVGGDAVEGGAATDEIAKTAEHVRIMKEKYVSASSLQSYLACPMKFFYEKVEGLTAADEVSEIMDAGMFGTVFHEVMQYLYGGTPEVSGGKVSIQYLETLREEELGGSSSAAAKGGESRIMAKAKELICQQLHGSEISGKNLIDLDIIVRYVLKTLERDIEILKEEGANEFTVKGLELVLKTEFAGFNFVGFIDRLDEIHEGELRVCDYKTGKVTDADRAILNGDVEGVAAVFGTVNKDRPKIALQLFIYNMLLRRNGYKEPLFDSIYQMASLFKEKPAAYPMDAEVHAEMERNVAATLRELEDLSVPFRRTEELETCEWCDFKMICGR